MRLKSIFFLFSLFIASWSGVSVSAVAQEKQEIEIWPGELPAGAMKFNADQIAKLLAKQSPNHLTYIERPTLTVYPAPADKATGCAVVICPGGGYQILAMPKEGPEVAEWFNSIGVTAFVLKYRIPRRTKKLHSEPMQDVQRAIRVVRRDAEKWNIDPDRIGTLGFSAGGHLTIMSGVKFNTQSYEPVDDADARSCRPNFIMPIYAAYLGDKYTDDTAKLSPLVTVTKDTPPTFMAVAGDDRMRGAQAATLYIQLRENEVPAELHVYSQGGHGFGIRDSDNPSSTWHHRLAEWMRASGFIDQKSNTD